MSDVSSDEPSPPSSDWLDRLAHAILQRKRHGTLLKRLHAICGQVTLVLAWSCFLGCSCLFLWLDRVGEGWWATAAFLYVPSTAWILPVIPLAILALFFRPGALWPLLFSLVVFLLYLDPQLLPHGKPPENTPTSIRVLTNNRGQINGTSLTPYIESVLPDLQIYQEAGRQSAYSKQYPDRHVQAIGEFTLISRYPILEASILPTPSWSNAPPVAVRSVLQWNEDQNIAIYNVHLPTPRGIVGPAVVVAGPILAALPVSSPLDSKIQKIREHWNKQIGLAEDLVAALREEKLPWILAGDLNVPDHGLSYRLFASEGKDTFKEAGLGLGYTFPGTTHNPLSGFGPWLRLDYIFCSEHWEVRSCETEPKRRSQHRAVFTVLDLPSNSP